MPSPLESAKLVGFVPVTDFAKARAFYEGVLGFRVLGEDQFALSLDAFGTRIRASKVPQNFTPAHFTILGWEVADIEATVTQLQAGGVVFERIGFFEQDKLGIWTAPSGDKVAWFKDPDGNTLSVSSHVQPKS